MEGQKTVNNVCKGPRLYYSDNLAVLVVFFSLVDVGGFEPPTSGLRCQRSPD